MNKIKELESKIEDLKKELEELKKAEKVNKRWRAEKEKTYFYIDSVLDVISSRECYWSEDYRRYVANNYYKTQEEAEAVAEKIKIYILS